jgi:Tfp pilus assembly protein PilX
VEKKMRIKHFTNNNQGVILLTVIMLTMVLSIVAISIMSIHTSQVTTSIKVIDTIKAEQLAQGVFYQYHQRVVDGTGSTPTSEIMDGRTFAVTLNSEVGGVGQTGPNSTSTVSVNINY